MSTLTLDGVLHWKVTGHPVPGDMVVRVFAAPGDLPPGWQPIGPVAPGIPFGAVRYIVEDGEEQPADAIVWRPVGS
jgi:hypothetical protein